MYNASSNDLQCTVNIEGGKMVCKTDKLRHVQELKGGEMVEVKSTLPEFKQAAV